VIGKIVRLGSGERQNHYSARYEGKLACESARRPAASTYAPSKTFHYDCVMPVYITCDKNCCELYSLLNGVMDSRRAVLLRRKCSRFRRLSLPLRAVASRRENGGSAIPLTVYRPNCVFAATRDSELSTFHLLQRLRGRNHALTLACLLCRAVSSEDEIRKRNSESPSATWTLSSCGIGFP
jgi:hypothetical protein